MSAKNGEYTTVEQIFSHGGTLYEIVRISQSTWLSSVPQPTRRELRDQYGNEVELGSMSLAAIRKALGSPKMAAQRSGGQHAVTLEGPGSENSDG